MLDLVNWYPHFCRLVKVNLSWADGLAPANNLVRDLTIGPGGGEGVAFMLSIDLL